MAIAATLTPGKVFQKGEKITNAKLNQLARPTLVLSGSVSPGDVARADYSDRFMSGPYFFGYVGSAWDSGKAYVLNDQVYYPSTGDYFKCILANAGQVPTNVTYWTKITSGTASSYAVTISPAPSALVIGMRLSFKANAISKGAVTLNVQGLGAKAIKRNGAFDLRDGDLQIGQVVDVEYDGTNWQLMSPVGVLPQNNDFVGASALVSGVRGFVPAPAAGQQSYYLRADGVWVDPIPTIQAQIDAVTITLLKYRTAI